LGIFGVIFDIRNIENKLAKIIETSNNPELWNDKISAENVLKEKSYLESTIDRYYGLKNEIEYYKELIDVSENDENLNREINGDLLVIKNKTASFEVEAMFKDEEDKGDCFLEINTGVGGTDACDFSSMLLDMYIKWCRDNNFKIDIINLQNGDEAGITNAIIQVYGVNAFGWLKNESGVHRLVRMSPYNANGKRQTSFSSVCVYPIGGKISIDINENDLKIDTYRSSGAGGQHVNKTDSAVRITHLPTKTVVQCQSQRSQHQNKEEALHLLMAKLHEMERQKQQEEKDRINNQKTNNGWGYQIRNYIMHPYQLIKDLRSGYEVNNVEKMLNGEYLSEFIRSNLK
jgi:peptide chain release factor 2